MTSTWVCRTVLAVMLSFAASIAAAPAAAEVNTDFECYNCHSNNEITPWITKTWAGSMHAKAGVICSDCHGNHDAGFDSADFTALPGASVCHKCHPIKVKETLSGPHANKVKCTSCHPRHSFSLAVAGNPKICSTCHSGSEHVDGYEKSKMGVVYATEGPGNSATCQTCHMPEGTHNVGLTMGSPELMLKVCNNCHSASFVGNVLSTGDFKLHW